MLDLAAISVRVWRGANLISCACIVANSAFGMKAFQADMLPHKQRRWSAATMLWGAYLGIFAARSVRSFTRGRWFASIRDSNTH